MHASGWPAPEYLTLTRGAPAGWKEEERKEDEEDEEEGEEGEESEDEGDEWEDPHDRDYRP